MKPLAIAAALVALALSGCASPAPVGPGEAPPELQAIPGSVWYRWHDPEYQVVCWIKVQAYGDAISCLREAEALTR